MKDSNKNEVVASKTNSVSNNPLKNSDGIVTIELQHLLTPLAILISGFMIALVLFFGFRELSGNGIKAGSSDTTTADDSAAGTTTGDTAELSDTDPNKFSDSSTTIDDDPIKGDKEKATIAIVEYSDFQCPFCKRAYEQTYPDLIKKYVDTGKAIYVIRDYPLSFHAMAKPAALAANCARDQGGDSKFYEFHDKMFSVTLSTQEQITQAATDIGLDMTKYNDCVNSGKFTAEVDADMEAGTKAGVSGTPGFVIGKLDKDGNVKGKLVGGAYGSATFDAVIKEYL